MLARQEAAAAPVPRSPAFAPMRGPGLRLSRNVAFRAPLPSLPRRSAGSSPCMVILVSISSRRREPAAPRAVAWPDALPRGSRGTRPRSMAFPSRFPPNWRRGPAPDSRRRTAMRGWRACGGATPRCGPGRTKTAGWAGCGRSGLPGISGAWPPSAAGCAWPVFRTPSCWEWEAPVSAPTCWPTSWAGTAAGCGCTCWIPRMRPRCLRCAPASTWRDACSSWQASRVRRWSRTCSPPIFTSG